MNEALNTAETNYTIRKKGPGFYCPVLHIFRNSRNPSEVCILLMVLAKNEKMKGDDFKIR
ncbi:hypothetical protein [Sutcliffiella sp. FSL R7-0096]|uniref:hypothetical protein n=1 Tax=Sutcliffiella sp. FSL R7-0096 TaxID=2921670 RepID=UPI00315AE5AA